MSLQTTRTLLRVIVSGAALLLAVGCNAFDDPPANHDDADGDFGQPSPPTAGRAGGAFGGLPVAGSPVGPSRPPDLEFGPTPPSCIKCGAFCSDCGRGCECLEGHTMFEPALWTVPFTGAGDDGWRKSSIALCPGMESLMTTFIWGHDDSVYALTGGNALLVDARLPTPDDDAGVARADDTFGALTLRTRVFRNDGRGWTLRADLDGASSPTGLIPIGESLYVYGGPGEDRRACSLGAITGDAFECELRDAVIRDVTVVSPTLAYALHGTSTLRVFDGAKWSVHADAIPLEATALWADERQVVAVGADGNVMRLRDGTWNVENVGQTVPLTAVWGAGESELWVGTFGGALLHFDGSAWQEVAQLGGVTCSVRLPIDHIFGVGSHVWVNTAAQLARWDGNALTSFGNWSCSAVSSNRITNVWGSSESDVFVSVAGTDVQPPCGPAFFVHYDGELFHRF
jgi:hypothetical protein